MTCLQVVSLQKEVGPIWGEWKGHEGIQGSIRLANISVLLKIYFINLIEYLNVQIAIGNR